MGHILNKQSVSNCPFIYLFVFVYTIFKHESITWFLWNSSFLKGWHHFWTVAQEIRFYLLLPLILIILSFFKKPVLQFLVLLVLICVSFKYRGMHTIDMLDGRHVYFYFFMFLGGVSTAFVNNLFNRNVIQTHANIFLVESVKILVFALFFLSSTDMHEHFWQVHLPRIAPFIPNVWNNLITWFSILFIFFLSVLRYQKSLINKILTCYILKHLGLLSYSLYLSHVMILQILRGKGFANEELFFLTLFLAIL